MKIILILVILLLVLAQAYVRLSPNDPARWHAADPFTAGDPGVGGALWLPEGRTQDFNGQSGAEMLAAIDQIALDTPRTIRIAGSPAEGKITYETRSLLWGFPDFTTIAVRDAPQGAELAALARSRFGKGDMGVNAARLKSWSQALKSRTGASL